MGWAYISWLDRPYSLAFALIDAEQTRHPPGQIRTYTDALNALICRCPVGT
jgi:hypothetical protein